MVENHARTHHEIVLAAVHRVVHHVALFGASRSRVNEIRLYRLIAQSLKSRALTDRSVTSQGRKHKGDDFIENGEVDFIFLEFGVFLSGFFFSGRGEEDADMKRESRGWMHFFSCLRRMFKIASDIFRGFQ